MIELKMEKWWLVIVAVSLQFTITFVSCDETAKPVSSVLRASWSDTPLLLEARYSETYLFLLFNKTKYLY